MNDTDDTTRRVGRKTMFAALIAGVASFLAVAAVPADAAWTATATVAASAAAPVLTVTQSGADTLSTTFRTDAKTHTSGIVVRNTSTVAGDVTVTAAAGGDLAHATRAEVWTRSTVAACTTQPTPIEAVVGTWADFPSLAAVRLSAGSSVVVCVRSTVTDVELAGAPGGSQSLAATVTAHLTAGSWTVSSAAASATLATEDWHPLPEYRIAGVSNWYQVRSVSNPTLCLDTTSASILPNAVVGTLTCTSFSKQRYEISPRPDGEMAFHGKHAVEMSLGATGGLTLQTASTASSAAWRLERVEGFVFRFVHRDTGLCMTTVPSAQNTLTPCTDATTQQFTLTRDPLTCAASTQLTLDWAVAPTNRQYTVQYRVADAAWTSLVTTTASARSTTIDRSAFGPADGTVDLRIIDSRGYTTYGGMTVDLTSSSIACGYGFG